MKLLLYVRIPKDVLSRKSIYKALSYLKISTLHVTETYSFLDDEFEWGLKLLLEAEKKVLKNYCNALANRDFFSIGILSENPIEFNYEYKRIDFKQRKPREPKEIIDKAFTPLKPRVDLKEERFTTKGRRLGYCPYCYHLHIVESDYINRPSSHVYKCKIRFDKYNETQNI